MAHTAIFLKRVCHQMIYDNWHTATCMKYWSANSTESLQNLAQKVSHMLLKLNKPLFKYWGVFPWLMSLLWGHQGLPLDVAGVFPLLNLGISSFIQFFLILLLNLDFNSATYHIIYKKILEHFNITIFHITHYLIVKQIMVIFSIGNTITYHIKQVFMHAGHTETYFHIERGTNDPWTWL